MKYTGGGGGGEQITGEEERASGLIALVSERN